MDETVKIAEYPLEPESVKAADAASHPGPVALLDNIRSAWNVGAIFRTADGFGFSGLHLRLGILKASVQVAVKVVLGSLGVAGRAVGAPETEVAVVVQALVAAAWRRRGR